MIADPRPAKRVKDPALMKQLHSEWTSCVLCGRGPISLHHLTRRSQGGGDTRENLCALCTSCHDRWHQADAKVRALLAEYVDAR